MRRRRIARTGSGSGCGGCGVGALSAGVGRHRQPPRRVPGGGGGQDPGPRMGRGRGPDVVRSWFPGVGAGGTRGGGAGVVARPRRCPGARASRAGEGLGGSDARSSAAVRRVGAGARATAAPARPPWDGFGSAPPRRRGCRRRGTPGWPRASRPSRGDVRGEKWAPPTQRRGRGREVWAEGARGRYVETSSRGWARETRNRDGASILRDARHQWRSGRNYPRKRRRRLSLRTGAEIRMVAETSRCTRPKRTSIQSHILT